MISVTVQGFVYTQIGTFTVPLENGVEQVFFTCENEMNDLNPVDWAIDIKSTGPRSAILRLNYSLAEAVYTTTVYVIDQYGNRSAGTILEITVANTSDLYLSNRLTGVTLFDNLSPVPAETFPLTFPVTL